MVDKLIYDYTVKLADIRFNLATMSMSKIYDTLVEFKNALNKQETEEGLRNEYQLFKQSYKENGEPCFVTYEQWLKSRRGKE